MVCRIILGMFMISLFRVANTDERLWSQNMDAPSSPSLRSTSSKPELQSDICEFSVAGGAALTLIPIKIQ